MKPLCGSLRVSLRYDFSPFLPRKRVRRTVERVFSTLLGSSQIHASSTAVPSVGSIPAIVSVLVESMSVLS